MTQYTEHFPSINGPFVLSIGKFDGVHIGHRRILDTLLEEAGAQQAQSVVYSFEPLAGTPLLTTAGEKLALFESLGVGAAVTVEFTEELMALTAERFIQCLADCGDLKAVVVGRDFRFGRGAAGDVGLLNDLGARYGFTVRAVGPVELDGRPVSSTAIRQCVRAGKVELAARMLGREYALQGQVARGKQIGRTIGFRTVNISLPEGKVVPAFGVYACRVDALGRAWPAMTNIGVNPTVGADAPVVESHLLGFEGDLYGQRIAVRLISKIRDEIKFMSLEHLQEQLEQDKRQVTELLA